MPTSTIPFEISLDFINDTYEPVLLRLTPAIGQGEESQPTMIIQPKETVSLVLDAGSTYRYSLLKCKEYAQVSCVPRLYLHGI